MGNCKSSISSVTPKDKENKNKNEDGAKDGFPSEKTLMKKKELKDVLEADGIKWQEGDAWYVVEAAWVKKWLAYMEGNDSATEPGPINNRSLLFFNKDKNVREPKPLLRAARKEHMGHYRRVNHHVWNLWSGAYGCSGPAIFVTSPPLEDTSNWTVDPNFDWGASNLERKGGISTTGSARGAGNETARGPERMNPSTSKTRLAKGEMEDESINAEAEAKAAAFFDVTLNSPSALHRVKHPAARAGADGSAAAPRATSLSAGAREADQWMYGRPAGSGLLVE